MPNMYSRDILSPGFGDWMKDAARQGTLYPDPTYFDEDAARRMFLYELAPEQIEGFYPQAQPQQIRIRDLLDPQRRMPAQYD